MLRSWRLLLCVWLSLLFPQALRHSFKFFFRFFKLSARCGYVFSTFDSGFHESECSSWPFLEISLKSFVVWFLFWRVEENVELALTSRFSWWDSWRGRAGRRNWLLSRKRKLGYSLHFHVIGFLLPGFRHYYYYFEFGDVSHSELEMWLSGEHHILEGRSCLEAMNIDPRDGILNSLLLCHNYKVIICLQQQAWSVQNYFFSIHWFIGLFTKSLIAYLAMEWTASKLGYSH